MGKTFTISQAETGQRLDVWCVAHVASLSRRAIQKRIKEGQITVAGKTVKPKYIVRTGDEIVIENPPQPSLVREGDTTSVSIPIVYEDNDLVVINKPAGVAVHGARGISGPTIADWYVARYPNADCGEPGRLGIVHRLDKDTSGALVLAKTPPAYERLHEQFKRHRVRKEYLALVFGVPTGRDGRIVQSIGRSVKNPSRRTIEPSGKPAITEWQLAKKFGDDYALLRIFPFTGRTHQIRVHLHFLGYPIVGDQLYAFRRQRPPAGVTHQLLHAQGLTFQLMSGKKKTFEAPLPDDFAKVLEGLQK